MNKNRSIYNRDEINSILNFSIYFKDGGKFDISRLADMVHHLLIREEVVNEDKDKNSLIHG